MTGQVIKFGATGNYPSFPTDDNGTTITVKLMAGSVVAKQTVTGTATATGVLCDVADPASVVMVQTYMYALVLMMVPTVIWKKLVLQALLIHFYPWTF